MKKSWDQKQKKQTRGRVFCVSGFRKLAVMLLAVLAVLQPLLSLTGTQVQAARYVVVTTNFEKTLTASDGRTYRFTVTCPQESGVPRDAALEVLELDEEESRVYVELAEEVMDAADFAYARIFDISIVNREGVKIQPDAPVQVTARLLDAEDTGEDFTVLHFESDPLEEDDAAQPEQMDAETDGNAVSFSTDSFSAYAIVKGPSVIPAGWTRLVSFDEFQNRGAGGLYIGTVSGYYCMNSTAAGSQDRSTTGILKTKPAQSFPADGAVRFFFEQAEGTDGEYYIYCLDAQENRQYVRNTGDQNLTFTGEEGRTAFSVTADNSGRFRIFRDSRYWNMWNGAGGNHIAAWTSPTDGNNYFYFWDYAGSGGDPYELDGAAYGLMNWNGGTAGRALMGNVSHAGRMDARALTVMSRAGDNEDKLFVPDDSGITLWSFRWVGNDQYQLTAETGSGTCYLRVTGQGLSLVREADAGCSLQVIPGTGVHEGEICLKSGNAVLTYSGHIENGFTVNGSSGSEWLKLTEVSELTPEYFMIYSASKVSVSDPAVTNGSRIIVYTRSWNEKKKKYEFYAIDHDGSLIPVYESGDSIQWVGSRLNTALWNLVEYYDEESGRPNDYYELYNQYSGKFLAPQISSGQTLSDGILGINLDGRRSGRYYSRIQAWDEEQYAYAGLKTDPGIGRIAVCPGAEADDFYFAVMQDLPVDDQLTVVPTVDHTQYGITMKMTNFETRKEMSDFLGSDAGGAVNNADSGLLSTGLEEDGYPVTKAGHSLTAWFGNAGEVNHLFVQSTYSASGYYEYDSTQNFASLHGSDFVVYKELGTIDSGNSNHYKHGQFLPYNDLQPGVFASVNAKNLTDAGGTVLPESNPRKYEQMYLVQKADYYLGVEIEAAFTQTPDGLDHWGHDIIYEFTGDDDFWLYVDGELTIDLGGIHNALSGSVNYSTGDVYVNGTHTTLRALFESNYRVRNPHATEADVEQFLSRYFDEGSTIFRDYTTHTMKIFYLERGAGASNLHMRFNLASVSPGTVELTKELDGVDASESALSEFPYQIRYRMSGEEDSEGHLLAQQSDGPEADEEGVDRTDGRAADGSSVLYKNTVTPVTYCPSLLIGGTVYEHVFLLKPGETAEITLPDGATEYSITECGVDTEIYRQVSVNGIPLKGKTVQGTDGQAHGNRQDFSMNFASARDRARAAFVNTVDPAALRTLTVTKKLFREDGRTAIRHQEDGSVFHFRLYFGTEFDTELSPADMLTYHVKDPEGNYCSWSVEEQRFVSTGRTDFTALSDAEKEAVRFVSSMNGAVSGIPAGYTVEVREVLAGTRFMAEEREQEIPDGYSLQKYTLYSDAADNAGADSDEPVQGTVVAGKDPHVDICNLRGWGLRVNKRWADDGYMSERGDAWFAVFTEDGTGALTLVDGSVRRMKQNQSTLYWYFLKLPVTGVPFENYRVREVTVGDPVVDAGGNVTSYSSVVPVEEGQEVKISGRQKGESSESDFVYTVSCEQGRITPDSNVRVDTVTNYRPGIVLRKEDESGNPMSGVQFTLADEDGNVTGRFTSDAAGQITAAFLRENAEYTLTETKALQGYRGLQAPLKLRLENGNVTVGGAEPVDYILRQETGTEPVLTIVNRPYTLQIVKTDGDSNEALSGVHFALHREVKVDGVTSVDLNPVSGYADLVTDDSGIIPKLDNTLPAGVYELREKETPSGYLKLEGYIHFTVSATGAVSLGTCPEGVTLEESEQEDGTAVCTITVRNYRMKTPAPTGVSLGSRPYIWILVFGVLAAVLAVFRKRGTTKELDE